MTKLTGMKNNFRLIIVILAVVVLGFACSDCKECCMVTRSNGDIIEENECANFCGEELSEIESMETIEVGELTKGWECSF